MSATRERGGRAVRPRPRPRDRFALARERERRDTRERRKRARVIVRWWISPLWVVELALEGYDRVTAGYARLGATRRNVEALCALGLLACVVAWSVGGALGVMIAQGAGGLLVVYLLPGPSRALARRLWTLARTGRIEGVGTWIASSVDTPAVTVADAPAAPRESDAVREAEAIARRVAIDKERTH